MKWFVGQSSVNQLHPHATNSKNKLVLLTSRISWMINWCIVKIVKHTWITSVHVLHFNEIKIHRTCFWILFKRVEFCISLNYFSVQISLFFLKSITAPDLCVCNLRRGGGLWLFFVLSFQVVILRVLYTYGDRGTGVGFGILKL